MKYANPQNFTVVAVGAYRTFKLKSEAQREAAVKHALTKYPNAVIL